MKKVGQLMKDMGFNPNSSDSAKEAFIKYLIKQSAGVNVQTPSEKKAIQENPEKIVHFPKQLTFDFDENETTPLKKA
ncbi:hypothetical protein K2P97_01830 [bacterium]|nr:hypothetical protein [bacterium]